MNGQSGFQYMNQLGEERTPFFFMVDFEVEQVCVYRLEEMEHIYFDFNGNKNHSFSYGSNAIVLKKDRIPFMEYKASFDRVREGIMYGNTFLLNLTRATEVKTKFSLFDIFLNSAAKYKLFYKNQFVVFSPEPFVKISNSTISSFPMKGTANAAVPGAAEKLLNNAKEISEHYTIVDLIRNDLSMVASDVRVSAFRYLEEVISSDRKLFQLSSKIEGTLQEDWNRSVGSIFQTILPAGSVSGAPKKKTLEIIREAEGADRGFYTGVMGIFDGYSVDSGVMIRYIENREGKYFYKSGGGITFQSDLNSEYAELMDKIYVPIFGNH